jgi:hypothetical protein
MIINTTKAVCEKRVQDINQFTLNGYWEYGYSPSSNAKISPLRTFATNDEWLFCTHFSSFGQFYNHKAHLVFGVYL